MVYSVRDAIHWGLFEIIGEQMSEHDLRKDENASAHEQNDEVTRDNALFVSEWKVKAGGQTSSRPRKSKHVLNRL